MFRSFKIEDWGKTKTIVEVVAILFAGIFAFFTWGIDAYKASSPNWSVEIDSKSFVQYSGVKEDGKLSICDVPGCSEANTCRIEGTVVTKNKGKAPIELRNTEINIYIVPRNDDKGWARNSSAYMYVSKLCSMNSISGCYEASDNFTIGKLNDEVLYPAQEGWRPFAYEMTPIEGDTKMNLNEFSKSYQVLIMANQKIIPSSLNPFYLLPDDYNPFFEEKPSEVSYMVSNICNRNKFKTKDESCKADKCESN